MASWNLRAVLLVLVASIWLIGYGAAYAMEPKQIARQAFPSVVLITIKDKSAKRVSLGSGFVVGRNIIATNLHVINGGTSGAAKIVGQSTEIDIEGVLAVDELHDLALLKTRTSAPPLKISTGPLPEIGDPVYAIGNPQGLEGTFSQGIVSALRSMPSGRWIQISAPISPGSSGGPVLDANGDVVGIAVATLTSGQNLNFAIPVDVLRALLSKVDQSSVAAPIARFAKKLDLVVAKGQKDAQKPNDFGATSGVLLHSFTWGDKGSVSNSYSCSFSVTNRIPQAIAGTVATISFYSANDAQLDSTELDLGTVILQPGASKRITWGCDFDASIKSLTRRVQFSVLDYVIWSPESRCQVISNEFNREGKAFGGEKFCLYRSQRFQVTNAECLSCLK